jgi:hypothetical protein
MLSYVLLLCWCWRMWVRESHDDGPIAPVRTGGTWNKFRRPFHIIIVASSAAPMCVWCAYFKTYLLRSREQTLISTWAAPAEACHTDADI